METKFKNVLITGGSSGIGAALAVYYATSGAKNIFICGRNKERLAKVVEECKKLGTKAESTIVDVTQKEDVRKWIDACNKKAALNLVIANAGVASLVEIEENIYKTFATNINGVMHTVLPAIELYRTRKAKEAPRAIAIVSSVAGYHGLPSCPSYSASKACVKAYGEAMRVELGRENIQMNVICPGFVVSGITDKNTCPMPFLMSGEKAANIIGSRMERNIGLIAFPWQMRFAVWVLAILPNFLSNYIYSKVPKKDACWGHEVL